MRYTIIGLSTATLLTACGTQPKWVESADGDLSVAEQALAIIGEAIREKLDDVAEEIAEVEE